MESERRNPAARRARDSDRRSCSYRNSRATDARLLRSPSCFVNKPPYSPWFRTLFPTTQQTYAPAQKDY